MNYKQFDGLKSKFRTNEVIFNLLKNGECRVVDIQNALGIDSHTTPHNGIKALSHCINRKLDSDGMTSVYTLKKKHAGKNFSEIEHLIIKRTNINGCTEWVDPLKNNVNCEFKMKEYWFKRKLYGYGWRPNTKEGWGVTIAAVLSIIYFSLISSISPVTALCYNLFVVIILTAICYKKGEKPRWQWGGK